MPSPRWLAKLAIPIMAGAALVTSSAIATADPVNDGYLAQLQGLGFTGRRATRRPSSGWRSSSATISGGIGRRTRLPRACTPTRTAGAFITDKSQPW
jgi:hypothetical protein